MIALPHSLANAQRLKPAAYVLLALFAFLFFLPGQTTLPVLDRDEARFAQASKQMLESGDFIHIRFQDEPRLKKPVGIYWLQAASTALFSPDALNNIWSYRIPSFLAAILAVLLTAAIGARLFNPLTGLMAATLLMAALVLNAEARIAKTDAVLLSCTLAAQYALARLWSGRDSPRFTLSTFCVFWLALAAGFLIKGPMILLVSVGTLLFLRFTTPQRGWALGPLKPLWGIPLMLVLIAPWFLAILQQDGGELLQQSAQQDLLSKIFEGQNWGIGPPGLHLALLPVSAWPGSLLILLALPWIWRNRKDPAVVFCLAWVLPAWLVFELSLTKLLHYTLPLLPALFLLGCAAFLHTPYQPSRYRRAMLALWLMVSLIVILALTMLPKLLTGSISTITLALAAAAISACLLAVYRVQRGEIRAAWAMLVLASLPFLPGSFGMTLPQTAPLWFSRTAAQTPLALQDCPHIRTVTAGYTEPSLPFLTGTHTIMLTNGGKAAEEMAKDRCTRAIISGTEFLHFQQATAGWNIAELGQHIIYNYTRGRFFTYTLYGFAPEGR